MQNFDNVCFVISRTDARKKDCNKFVMKSLLFTLVELIEKCVNKYQVRPYIMWEFLQHEKKIVHVIWL